MSGNSSTHAYDVSSMIHHLVLFEPRGSKGSSVMNYGTIAQLRHLEDILIDLLELAKAHEAQADGLRKFAQSRRMQALLNEAVNEVRVPHLQTRYRTMASTLRMLATV